MKTVDEMKKKSILINGILKRHTTILNELNILCISTI